MFKIIWYGINFVIKYYNYILFELLTTKLILNKKNGLLIEHNILYGISKYQLSFIFKLRFF